MTIIHNEKQIIIPPFYKIELEYINEFNNTSKSKHIILIYDKDHQFEIPLEKIVTLRHMINNNLSIISENSLSENRTIIISLYSPVIFKNKSMFPMQIKIKNYKYGISFLNFYPNSIVGLPLNLVNEDTFFAFKLINNKKESNNENDNYSPNFSLNKIINNDINYEYKMGIKFINKSLIMKLDHKIRNVRTLIINTQYSIVNCLPCDLFIYLDKYTITLSKCSQYYIDINYDSELIVGLGINTDYGRFITNNINLLSLKEKNEDNSIKFKNKENGRYFNLLFYYKKNEEENSLIIYSEFILYNKSGINIAYYFENIHKLLCFKIAEKIYLICSKIDFKEEKIKLYSDSYSSKNITISQMIEASPNLKIKMEGSNENYILLNIKKKFSYITISNNPNFKENIRTMVFSILNYCRIINLLSTKKFIIINYNNKKRCLEIGPLEKRGFLFFSKGPDILLGITVTNLNVSNYSNLIKIKFKPGIYTLSTDDFTFNLDIRENPSNGCLDVFVIENNIENSHIIVENLSNQGISIFQKNYDEYTQILLVGEKQALKIYDYYSKIFIIQTPNSVTTINFDNIKKNGEKIELNEEIMLLIEANGIKIKATFYITEVYKKLKSTLFYKNYSFNINKIYISMIGDNEYPDTKLNNYIRKELLLFYFSGFSLVLKIITTDGVLNKVSINSSLILDNFEVYNQASERGKFSCLFTNKTSPFITLSNEINFYNKLKIAKIEHQDFNVGKIELGIDPEFINEIFKFFDNILYRMNITNFNVHKLFLENIEYDPEKIIKKYNKSNILINATNILYPELNIEFELSKIGLGRLMRERMGSSDFYIWVAKGLVGNKQQIILENSYLSFKNGGIEYYLKWLYYIYMKKIEKQISDINYSAVFGKIKNIFSFDILFDDDSDQNDVKKFRKREPRAFFGKFKYFKEYDRNDAIIIKNIFSKNKILNNKYYPIKIIKGNKEFYLFTTIAMFCSDYNKYELKWNIDYFSIKNVESKNFKVLVYYNQKIDSKHSCWFECEDEEIAKNVAKCLNEEIINNRENLLEI